MLCSAALAAGCGGRFKKPTATPVVGGDRQDAAHVVGSYGAAVTALNEGRYGVRLVTAARFEGGHGWYAAARAAIDIEFGNYRVASDRLRALISDGVSQDLRNVVSWLSSEAAAGLYDVGAQRGALLACTTLRCELKAAELVGQQALREAVSKAGGDLEDRGVDDLLALGHAAQALAYPHDANDAFEQAETKDPTRSDVHLARAMLFYEYYNYQEAERSLAAALKINAADPQANLLAAELAFAAHFDEKAANVALDNALRVNPHLAGAHFLRAEMATRAHDFESAEMALDVAVSHLDDRAVTIPSAAAIRWVIDYVNAPTVRAPFPKLDRAAYERFLRLLEWEHAYDLIVDATAELDTFDPGSARLLAARGHNLLRLGREEEGRALLERAHEHSAFSPRVFNTLELYDNTIDKNYVWIEKGPLRLRVFRDKAALYQLTVLPFLHGAYQDLRGWYDFMPTGMTTIELFEDSQSFAVRTVGLPRLGLAGVCFGKVVTAEAPNGRQNWGAVLGHELAHVFHLQISQQRVPRWFSEGLAEYDASRMDAMWKRELDFIWKKRLETAGKNVAHTLPRFDNMNAMFTGARSPAEFSLAYYISTLVVTYFAETFGDRALKPALVAYSQGKDFTAILKTAGVSVDKFEADFYERERARLKVSDKRSGTQKTKNQIDKRAVMAPPRKETLDKMTADDFISAVSPFEHHYNLMIYAAQRLQRDRPQTALMFAEQATFVNVASEPGWRLRLRLKKKLKRQTKQEEHVLRVLSQ